MNHKLTKEWVRVRLPKRPKDANKGTFGKVLVVAGSENYPGAAYLTCAACYLVGAGLVALVTEPEVKIIVSRKLPEVTILNGEVILTPHPGEMARLTGLTVQKIQLDRVNIAKLYAKKWNKIVVLKGANTVIASPAGEMAISPFANPALATAGTGDVLAGVIAGFLAQGLDCF